MNTHPDPLFSEGETNFSRHFHQNRETGSTSQDKTNTESGNPHRRKRLSTDDLLIKIGCFAKKKNVVVALKSADLYKIVQGGQLY